jgi:predicted acylesterase/phospholipase RssA
MTDLDTLFKDAREKTALVISAGAPQAPLIAGAIHGLYDNGIRFNRIYASGGGALIAALLVAPKHRRGRNPTPAERLRALESIVEIGVEDAIFKVLPIGYKTFFKPGPFTAPFRAWAKLFKLNGRVNGRRGSRLEQLKDRYEEHILRAALKPKDREHFKRLYDDWIDLLTALITPGTLTPDSLGLCEPFPLADDVVDFELLRRWKGTLSVPAYDLTLDPQTRKHRGIVQFTNHPEKGEKQLDADGMRACFAAPFIYPPYRVDDGLYTEGAFEEPYNEDSGWVRDAARGQIRNVLILDILNREEDLVREPLDLWDAYGSSIMTPVVAQAKTVRRMFSLLKQENRERKDLLTDQKAWLEEDMEQLKREKKRRGNRSEDLEKKLARLRAREARLERELNWLELSHVHWMPRLKFPPQSPGNGTRYLADWSRGSLEALFEEGVKAAERYLQRPLSKVNQREDSAAEILRRRSAIDAALAESRRKATTRDLLPTAAEFRNEYGGNGRAR